MNSTSEKCSKILRAHDLYSSGKLDRIQRSFQQSIEQFKAAIELGRALGMLEIEVKCLRQLSLNYLEMDMMDDFRRLNECALAISKELKHRPEEARCINNLGVYYFKSNRYSRALDFYNESLKIARETSRNLSDEADCQNNIALIYLNLGDYDKAQRYLDEALAIQIKLDSRADISLELNNIGEILRNKALANRYNSQCTDIITCFYESLALSRKNKNRQVENLFAQ